VVDEVLQVRDADRSAFVLGKGKLDEVVLRAMQLDADVLIFDRNLSPRAGLVHRAVTDLKVIDRTQLILDIFAQRAESRDGKLQVELAQLKYMPPAPRAEGRRALAPHRRHRRPRPRRDQAGDRPRRARERVSHLEASSRARAAARAAPPRRGAAASRSSRSSATRTRARARCSTPSPGRRSIAEDKLFATLDTALAPHPLPGGGARGRRSPTPWASSATCPKDLFAAFRATFEETADADLLLHVVDASDLPPRSRSARWSETCSRSGSIARSR
jgi:GTP-binding protein HflX